MDAFPGSPDVARPRRRDRRTSEGKFQSMKRTASNISSTSSDILVAAPSQTPSQQPTQFTDYIGSQSNGAMSASSPKASAVVDKRLLRIRFHDTKLLNDYRKTIEAKPNPQAKDDDSDDEPNHRGTYSRAYKERHPEIKLDHVGQGRYRPASAVNADNSESSQHPSKQPNERVPGSAAASEEFMDQMIERLHEHFDDYRRDQYPSAKARWAPQHAATYKKIKNLFETTPRQQWHTVLDYIELPGHRDVASSWIDAMDQEFPMKGVTQTLRDSKEDGARTRISRQAKPAVPSTDYHRRSQRITDAPTGASYAEEEISDSDLEDDELEPTYGQDFVNANSGAVFDHVGNDRYRRGFQERGTRADDDRISRRDSTSLLKRKRSASDGSHGLDQNITLRKEDLPSYPGMVFHHKGNGWYRQGAAPDGRRGSIIVTATGELTSYNGLPAVPVEVQAYPEDIPILQNHHATVNKDFTERHSDIEWIHRGQGRYKRKSAVQEEERAKAMSTVSSDRRSSRADNSFTNEYAESHLSEDSRRTSGRRRSKPNLFLGEQEDFNEPSEKPSQRTQPRAARASRPSQATTSPELTMSSSTKGEEVLYPTAYVDKHPNDTFHHRGQGKWARGMPPFGSSNKTAVRGPGAKDKHEVLATGEENEFGERAPRKEELVSKDVKEKWGKLTWYYRGGGKYSRQTKDEALAAEFAGPSPKRRRTSAGKARADDAEAQLQREALAAETATDGPRRSTALLQRPIKATRKRSQQKLTKGEASKPSSIAQSKAPTPRPPLLPPEQDQVTEEDLPSLYKEEWSDIDEDELDEPNEILRRKFRPIVGPDPFVKALTKFDPAVRSIDSLKALATNAQQALKALQDEYLMLDAIVAAKPMRGKNERRPVKGGRVAADDLRWEDEKEAMLLDYQFKPDRIGCQDPFEQKIVRDEDGRALRRRGRKDPHATAVNYGDGEMTSKRAVKPVSRFDGVVVAPPRKRGRMSSNTEEGAGAEETPSMTPDRIGTPVGSVLADPASDSLKVPTSRGGRWGKDHVPKRILELRGESVGSTDRNNNGSSTPTGSPAPASGSGAVRKGRPPGSKNLHKRKDAGIKKGPRKPKGSASPTPDEAANLEMVVRAIVGGRNLPEDVPPAAAEREVAVRVEEAVNESLDLVE